MSYKTKRIIVDAILIILGIIFLVFGIKDAIKEINKNKVEDNILFNRDYPSVPKNNNFKYVTTKSLNRCNLDQYEIVVIADKFDKWSQVSMKEIDKAAKKAKKTVYYLEFDQMEDDKKEYKKLIKTLGVKKLDNLQIFFFKECVLKEKMGMDDIFSNDIENVIPADYWTQTNSDEFVKNFIKKVKLID